MIKAVMVTLKTEMPETAAASAFPPTAYIYLPSLVLFQTKYMMAMTATAQRIIVGNLPILGMIILGIFISIAPKETPLVAKVMRPNIISIFAIVEIKG